MNISKSTLAILKNFSEINQGITIKPGSVLRTIDGVKTMFARAVVSEFFDKQFSIFDIREFLSLITLPECDVELQDEFLTITDQCGRTVKYVYSSPNIVFSPSDKDIEIQSRDMTFSLLASDIQALYKKSSILKISKLYFTSKGLTLCQKRDSGNTFDIPLDVTVENEKTALVDLKNLKVLPLDYEVVVCGDEMIYFKSKNPEYMIEYLVTQDYQD